MQSFLTDCECSWSTTKEEFLVNCSYANLISVPNALPNSTTHLLLNNNNLHLIPNGAFMNLSHLICLDLSNCELYKMENMTFDHLPNLKTLMLKNNNLSANNASFPDDVFCPLENQLQTLDIRGNLKGLSLEFHTYPEKALSCLKSLQVLRMDCIADVNLPETLNQMHSLKTLDFSNGLKEINITNQFFNSVSKLQIDMLNFTNVNITRINGSIFSSLKSLRVLDLTNNSMLTFIVADIVHALRKTKIEVLNLTRTCFGAARQESIVMQELKETRIKVLIVHWNEIRLPNDSFFNVLPNIEELSVRNNGLIDFYGFFAFMFDASHLRKVDLSYQNYFFIEI